MQARVAIRIRQTKVVALMVSLLATAVFIGSDFVSPVPARGADAAATTDVRGAQPAAPVVGADPSTKAPGKKGFRFDASLLVGPALTPTLPAQRYQPGLNFQLPDGATLSVDYTRLKQDDFLSQDGFEGKAKAVVLGVTGGRSDATVPGRERQGETYNLSLFLRPSLFGGGGVQYLSGERAIMGVPESSMAMGVAAYYRLAESVVFDTTFEMSDLDGDRWVGGLHYLLSNTHVLSLQGRYVTSGDANIDEVPTVMFMYTIPFGAPQPVR